MTSRSTYRTSSYTIVAADIGSTQTFTSSSGSFTATLPAASTVPVGFKVTIEHDPSSTGSNSVTIARNGSDTLHALSANIVLLKGQTVTLHTNGSNGWFAYQGLDPSQLGVNSGIATLDSGGKLNAAQIPTALVGALQYQGTWNATTNTPTLVSSTGTKGQYYVVSVAGTTNIDGHAVWTVGDWIVFDGSVWEQIQGTISTGEITAALGFTPLDIAGSNSYSAANFTMTSATAAIRLGGSTASFPMLKRSGSGVSFRLADDSGDALVSAANFYATGYFGSANKSLIYPNGTDGNIVLYNNAATGFSLLQFGGTTSSFPAVARSGTTLQVRLADNSAYADLYANNFVANGNQLFFGTNGNFTASSDGVFRLMNNAGTGFSLLQFGGTTSSFPAIKRSGTALFARLADDSDWTEFDAGNLYSQQNVGWASKSLMRSSTDGNISLFNNAGTGFSLLQFGGTTSSFPAWKRSGDSLLARLADDSGFTDIYGRMGSFASKLVFNSGTAPPAGGNTSVGIVGTSTSNFGIFAGSGVPTLTAAQGSFYLRSDGVPYVNLDGATNWSAVGVVGAVTWAAITNGASLSNGLNAQAAYIYNTFTSGSIYERATIDWQTTANTLTIGAQAVGSGTVRPVSFVGASFSFNNPISSSSTLALGGATIGANVFSATGSGVFSGQVNVLALNAGSNAVFLNGAATGDINTISTGRIGFAPSTAANAAPDSAFSRISAGLIGVGTGAQGSTAGSLSMATLALAANIPLVVTDTTAGTSTAGPVIGTYRNLVGATNQILGQFQFSGNNTSSSKKLYGTVGGFITDATTGAEKGGFLMSAINGAGGLRDMMYVDGYYGTIFAAGAIGQNYILKFTTGAATGSVVQNIGLSGNNLIFQERNVGNTVATIYYSGSDFGIGTGSAQTTSATGGFLLLPTMAGAASGTPTNAGAGKAPVTYDTTNNILRVYNGTWQGFANLVSPSFTGTVTATNISLTQFSETYTAPAITSNVLTINLTLGTVFNVTNNANITTFTISNAVASRTSSFTVFFTGNGTAFTQTWGSSVKWAGGTAPTLTSTNAKTDIITFTTNDGGTTWFGFVGGQNF